MRNCKKEVDCLQDIELFMCHGTQSSLRTTLRLHQHSNEELQERGGLSSGYRTIHVSWNTEQSEDNSETTSTLCSCLYDIYLPPPIIHY